MVLVALNNQLTAKALLPLADYRLIKTVLNMTGQQHLYHPAGRHRLAKYFLAAQVVKGKCTTLFTRVVQGHITAGYRVGIERQTRFLQGAIETGNYIIRLNA